MSDDLERKRQEKIANFKLNLDIGDNDETGTELISNTGTIGGTSESTSSAEISSGNDSDSELSSYSSVPGGDLKGVDKKSLKKAKKTE